MAIPQTLNQLYFGTLERFGSRPVAMRSKRAGRWVDFSYKDVAGQVQDLSIGLRELGVRPGDRVAILSENRPEWAITDYACLAARCTDVPIYPTLPARQAEYILRDSGACAVLASSRQQVEKVRSIQSQLPALTQVIAFDENARGPGVLGYDEVLARGRQARARYPRWQADAMQVGAEDLATIIYTSGTTGDPKGVMLSHENLTSNVTTCVSLFSFSDEDECLSFLPLSHIFERMFGQYSMWYAGVVINYAESVETVPADMQDRRPTVMASVPRLYEKIYSRVLENVRNSSALRQRLFAWGRRVGEEWAELATRHRPVPKGLAFQKQVADRLVFAKLRARTGGRVRFFISGGAPLSPEIAKFFFAAGIPILEGYGLTETSPVMAVNLFEHFKLGTVGRAIPGVELRIAPDGEILTRGPNVMQGYFGKPEATADAIDAEGWFHTGDIGVIDSEGYLQITDRKKDLIVTAGGKNIAPQPIENLVKSCKFVCNAVMLGDRRPFPIMLVVPHPEPLREWATANGHNDGALDQLLTLPAVREKLEAEVRKTLRDLAQFEMPKKLLLLSQDFTLEKGELTPTLKVRRRVVEEHNRAAIERLYRHEKAAVEPKGQGGG
jgi:long-chain acyl-CoA synthetase